jgi:hypothetical protein
VVSAAEASRIMCVGLLPAAISATACCAALVLAAVADVTGEAQPPHAAGATPAPAGYLAWHSDCGYPVCQTIIGMAGKSPVPPTTLEKIAQVCNNTAHCMGFNSNDDNIL